MNIKSWVSNSQVSVSYSRMWPYIKPFWKVALLSMIICIPVGSLDAVIALFLKPYTDIVVVGKNMESPWYIPMLIVGFTTIQGLLNYGGIYLTTWVGGKLTNSLKSELYGKLVDMESAYFDKTTSGLIFTRFSRDADMACSGLLDNLKRFLTRIFSSIALIGVLFYNSWQLSILAVVILIIAIAPMTKVRSLLKSLFNQSNGAVYKINTTYNETFAGHRTIAAYNLQNRQIKSMDNHLNEMFMLSVAMTRRTGWMSPFMHFVISIGLGLAIAFGSWLIVNNHITPGNFVSFIAALLMLYTPLKNISNVAVSVQKSFFAIERVFSILDRKIAIVDKPNAHSLDSIYRGIRFEKVNFAYKKNKTVLHDINLDVQVGETIALVGNSGGGKSTLVSLITRFYDVTKGKILIDDMDIRDIRLFDLRKNIAVVFQENFLFGGTIKDNLLIGKPDATDEEIEEALKNACLTEFIASLKHGVDTEIGERGTQLSGGQKQRVAIARAFLKNAPIIILDEATSALDNKSEKSVQQAIDNLMKNKTVFVIAHRLSTVRNADRIAVINEGKLVELGSHDDLMAIPCGHYRTLYDMQFKESDRT